MFHNTYAPVSDTLVAENIFLTIGMKEILKGVTIRASKNSITGLLGRNGAGKSTMMQSVFGARRAAECDVSVNGVKTKSPYTIKGLVNYLPQHAFLPGHLSIRRLAQHFAVNAEDILNHFPELEPDLAKPLRELSGGQLRLVSVLLILLAPTRFTLLDEPFSHIMPLHVDKLCALLVQQKQHKGIIITDHLYRPLLQVSDKLFLMREGKSIYIREREDLVLHGYISDAG